MTITTITTAVEMTRRSHLITSAYFDSGLGDGLGGSGRAGERAAIAFAVLSLVFECSAIVTPSVAQYRAPVNACLNRPPSKGNAGTRNHSLVDNTATRKPKHRETAPTNATNSVIDDSLTVKR